MGDTTITEASRVSAPPAGAHGTPATIATVPEADLVRLQSSGDVGATIAALVMMSERERKKTSKTDRDAAYGKVDRLQGEEIAHMESAATTRLFTGVAKGATQLGDAAATIASAHATYYNDEADAGLWKGTGKGFEAAGTLGDAVGGYFAGELDIHAKESANAAERAKHVADDLNDEYKDANESIKKSVEFLKEWNTTHDATMMAAIHRA